MRLAAHRLLTTAVLLAAIGCGPDPAKRNQTVAKGQPLVASSRIQTVIELDVPPGNVVVAPDGRVFFTFHPATDPPIHVAEATPDGSILPFPGIAWQSARDDGPHFVSPLALRVDRLGRLWVLDHGAYGRRTPSLTAFDLAARTMVDRFEFPREVAGWGSMLNDFRIDTDRSIAYIADTSPYAFDPALIVYDLEARTARRVLEDHPSVAGERQHMVVQGQFMRVLGLPLRVAVDSIALSEDGQTLYYGPMTGSRMYRISTDVLRDASWSNQDLAAHVREHAAKPSTDGIVADRDGALYLTAIEASAVWKLLPSGGIEVLAQDDELLSWPDGVDLSPDERWLYVTASELQHVLGADLDELPDQRPFRIVRVPLSGIR